MFKTVILAHGAQLLHTLRSTDVWEKTDGRQNRGKRLLHAVFNVFADENK